HATVWLCSCLLQDLPDVRRRVLPGEQLRACDSLTLEFLTQRAVLHHTLHPPRNRLNIVGIDQHRRVPYHFWQSREGGGHDRCATRHGLEGGQSKALIERRTDQCYSTAIIGSEFCIGELTRIHHPVC